MERPLSMSSASVLPSMHKRTISAISTLSKHRSPSLTSLFITNLKLLNLDLLPGCPALSALTFTSNDTKTRFAATEWSLYHLFRLYDPRLTADKLQPFFPPLEHMQSVNLRSALHRSLAELKKSGALGKEAVLRKTMLDDCSGDKFWELCLIFSATVLRKVSLDSRPARLTSFAHRVAVTPALDRQEKDSLIPLAIAHKAALTNLLQLKARRKTTLARVGTALDAREDELLERVNAIESQKSIITSTQHAEDLHTIEKAITESSRGQNAFIEAIINGDSNRPSDAVLLQSQQDFVSSLHRSQDSDEQSQSAGLIDELQRKVKAQRSRIDQWQAIYTQLRPQPSTQSALPAPSTSQLSYNKHQELSVEDAQESLAQHSTRDEPVRAYLSRYDEILNAMREDLRRAHTSRRESASPVEQPDPIRKPSITIHAVAGAPNPAHTRSPSRRSISPIIPFRPGFDRRVNSRSRSYQQPRVVSQREPIPLKAEGYSPIKTDRRDTGLPSDISTEFDHAQDSLLAKRESQSSMDAPTIDSGIGLGLNITDSPIDAQSPVYDGRSEVDRHVSVIRQAAPIKHSSLVERTRLSMAGQQLSVASAAAPAMSDDDVSTTPPSQDDLAARTRQSILAHDVGTSSKTRSKVNGSVVHTGHSLSVNKTRHARVRFEPGPDEISQAPLLQTATYETQRDITPREKLFEADAEASSIFRSRPKIASSPVLSPLQIDDNLEHNNME